MEIGRVTEIRIWPVKSMKGESINLASIGKNGIEGDRRYAIIDESKQRKGGPSNWTLNARSNGAPSMMLIKPYITNEGIEVMLPDGRLYDIWNPAVIDYLSALDSTNPRQLNVEYNQEGYHDQAKISIMGNSTISTVKAVTGAEGGAERFRANFSVDWNTSTPFWEDGLVGKVIKIGTAVIKIDSVDNRCDMINKHPNTALDTPARSGRTILKEFGALNKGHLGVYGSVVEEGMVSPSGNYAEKLDKIMLL